MWNGRGHFLLIILLLELPILTFCQTTLVFYQNLTGCKAKNAVFSEKVRFLAKKCGFLLRVKMLMLS
jgi:hypothetical protein